MFRMCPSRWVGKFVSWQRRLLVEERSQGHPDVVPRQPHWRLCRDLQVPRPAGGVSRRANSQAANPKHSPIPWLPGLRSYRPALSSNVKNGAEIAANICASCHGESGVSPNPQFPHMAGQSAFALYKQLHDFKNGARINELMASIVQDLDDEQMAEALSHCQE